MHPEIKSCVVFPLNTPVEAELDSESGPGWDATLEGLHMVSSLIVFIHFYSIVMESYALHALKHMISKKEDNRGN